MKAPTPPSCIDLARAEVHAIPLDRRQRRRWSRAPRQVAEIVRLLRASGQQINDFAAAVGMPPSVLSRHDRGLRTTSGKLERGGKRNRGERPWPELQKLIQPRATLLRAATRRKTPAPVDDAAEVRLLGDNSIEIVRRRVVPYGSEEHARLLPLAVSRRAVKRAA